MSITHPDGEQPPTQLLDPPRSLGPWQIEIANHGGTATRVLRAGQELVIGSARDVSLRVEDQAVSARHVHVEATREGLRVRDLGSMNGLRIGGARVESALLSGPHCGFVIGRTTVSVYPVSESEAPRVGEVPGLIGHASCMRRLARDVHRFAALGAPVLLQGESGSGKEVVARALHTLSGRRGEFVALNAGGMSEALADTELFGHSRGAFTGAVTSRAGAFAQAHTGTLFLDEIADLDPSVQVKLLRVIEDGLVRPLGGQKAQAVDVRVISASWSSLERRVQRGEFRADLYHRIATVTLVVPPLRNRVADLPLLSKHWLSRLVDELGTKELTAAALACMVDYSWPGNVRELGSVLYRAAVASGERPFIELHHIEAALPKSGRCIQRPHYEVDAQRLLAEHSGNVSAAARAAQVPRTTFRSWLRKGGASSPGRAA
jgi:DNA-binding NtrC family response regulator